MAERAYKSPQDMGVFGYPGWFLLFEVVSEMCSLDHVVSHSNQVILTVYFGNLCR